MHFLWFCLLSYTCFLSSDIYNGYGIPEGASYSSGSNTQGLQVQSTENKMHTQGCKI